MSCCFIINNDEAGHNTMIKIDRFVFALLIISLSAVKIVSDNYLGTFFEGILFGAILLYIMDNKVSLYLENASYNKNNWIKSIGIALLGAVIVSVGGVFIKSIVNNIVAVFTLESMITSYAEMTPYFQGNLFFIWLSFTILISSVESIAVFGAYLEVMLDKLKTKPGFNAKAIGSIILISLLFAFLHLSSKQGEFIWGDLAVVFFMGIISCLMVLYTKQLKEAILMHIMLNGMAIIYAKKIFYTLFASSSSSYTIFVIIFSLAVVSLISYGTRYLGGVQTTLR